MRGNTRTKIVDLRLRVVADKLHHQVRIESGFVNERIPLDAKARTNICEDFLTDADNIREIAKDPITPIGIGWPEVRAFELKKRRFVSDGFALSAEVQLLTPIPLVLHLAITTEVSRVLNRNRGFDRLRKIKERTGVVQHFNQPLGRQDRMTNSKTARLRESMSELLWIEGFAIKDWNVHDSTSMSQSRAVFSCAIMSVEGVFLS